MYAFSFYFLGTNNLLCICCKQIMYTLYYNLTWKHYQIFVNLPLKYFPITVSIRTLVYLVSNCCIWCYVLICYQFITNLILKYIFMLYYYTTVEFCRESWALANMLRPTRQQYVFQWLSFIAVVILLSVIINQAVSWFFFCFTSGKP